MNFNGFYLDILKETKLEEPILGDIPLDSTCFLITRNYIGDTETQLSLTLMKSFIYVMAERETKPSDIILMNKGVLLAVEGSPTLSAFRELERNGVSILCCGASLNGLKVRDHLGHGYISNMYDILEVLMRAKKVITL